RGHGMASQLSGVATPGGRRDCYTGRRDAGRLSLSSCRGPRARGCALAVRLWGEAFLREPVVNRAPDLLAFEDPVAHLHRFQAVRLRVLNPKRIFPAWGHAIQCIDVGMLC